MTRQVTGTQKVRPHRRVGGAILSTIVAAGLILSASAPAQAAPTVIYTVWSSWYEAYAGATSTGGAGELQGHAYLGNARDWGVKSKYNTKAYVFGFSFTHNAILYRNGAVFTKAQR